MIVTPRDNEEPFVLPGSESTSGCVGGLDDRVTGRVNPRRIGFVRDDELDIPIYWEPDAS